MDQANEQPVKKAGFTKKERNWILYDVANSAYVLLATALLSFYFDFLSPTENLTPIWGSVNVIVTVIAVVLCPILGTYADFSKKRRLFMTFALIGIISCALLSVFSLLADFAIAGILFLIVYIAAEVGFSSANVFYDSMLSDVTTDEPYTQSFGKRLCVGIYRQLYSLCILLGFVHSRQYGISPTVGHRLHRLLSVDGGVVVGVYVAFI